MTRPPLASEVFGKWLSAEADAALARRRYCNRVVLAGTLSLMSAAAPEFFLNAEVLVYNGDPLFVIEYEDAVDVLLARNLLWKPLWSVLRVGGAAVSGETVVEKGN